MQMLRKSYNQIWNPSFACSSTKSLVNNQDLFCTKMGEHGSWKMHKVTELPAVTKQTTDVWKSFPHRTNMGMSSNGDSYYAITKLNQLWFWPKKKLFPVSTKLKTGDIVLPFIYLFVLLWAEINIECIAQPKALSRRCDQDVTKSATLETVPKTKI